MADSSLHNDRTLKLAIYAEAGIPEYWIVDVNTSTIEVFTQPAASLYACCQIARDGDVLRPTLLPNVAIAVADLPR